jgi:glutamyl/glutaminyl-tRNA synthetase
LWFVQLKMEIEKGLIFKRTRYAPTPSGYLHLGNVLSFAITAAIAEKTNARIFLRIDDVDRERTNKVFVQDIFDTLNFLELPWHEGPKNLREFELEYSQMLRLDMYNKALQQLRDGGKVFACTCSRADVQRLSKDNIYSGTCRNKGIPLDAEDVSWRLNTSEAKELGVKTVAGKVVTAVLPDIMQDFVVRRRDGYPGYQLTSLIDDVHFGIDLVVRGEDLWPSTLAQQYLASELGLSAFRDATFYHHRLIDGPDGTKLSKSAGATSVQYYREQHKAAADVYMVLAEMMGISAPVKTWQELASFL